MRASESARKAIILSSDGWDDMALVRRSRNLKHRNRRTGPIFGKSGWKRSEDRE